MIDVQFNSIYVISALFESMLYKDDRLRILPNLEKEILLRYFIPRSSNVGLYALGFWDENWEKGISTDKKLPGLPPNEIYRIRDKLISEFHIAFKKNQYQMSIESIILLTKRVLRILDVESDDFREQILALKTIQNIDISKIESYLNIDKGCLRKLKDWRYTYQKRRLINKKKKLYKQLKEMRLDTENISVMLLSNYIKKIIKDKSGEIAQADNQYKLDILVGDRTLKKSNNSLEDLQENFFDGNFFLPSYFPYATKKDKAYVIKKFKAKTTEEDIVEGLGIRPFINYLRKFNEDHIFKLLSQKLIEESLLYTKMNLIKIEQEINYLTEMK